MTAPTSDPTPVAPPSGAPANDADAPPPSGPLVVQATDSGPPPSGATPDAMRAAIARFLASRKDGEGRDFVASVVVARLGKDIDDAMKNDIVQAAMTEALVARRKPWFEHKIPAWAGRITARAIAHYFRPGEVHKKWLDRSVNPVDTSDRRAPETDWRARGALIYQWLEKRIGDDPKKVETLRLMSRHENDGFTLPDLAKETGLTPRALANRFHKLRKELAPQVRLMDDENKRLAVIVGLWILGVAAAIAIVAALALWLAAPPPVAPAEPALRPAPSASAVPAPPPVFDNANPTRPPFGDASPSQPPGKR